MLHTHIHTYTQTHIHTNTNTHKHTYTRARAHCTRIHKYTAHEFCTGDEHSPLFLEALVVISWMHSDPIHLLDGPRRSHPSCGSGGVEGTGGGRLHFGKAGWPERGCWRGDLEFPEKPEVVKSCACQLIYLCDA